MLSEAERQQLLVQWNDTRRAYEAGGCLHELFEAQAERRPAVAAVVYEDQQLSYGELNERANQLAHYLRRLGVGPEVLVGLLLERSLELVVGVMGILKAGGAYVPLNPSYPAARIGVMLDSAPVLLTQERLVKTLPPHAAQVVCLDSDWAAIGAESSTNPEPQTTSRNIAYVIYTSGSTGQPKGVIIEHRSTLNLVAALDDLVYHEHPPPLRLTINAPFVFDASVHQLIELGAGHTIYPLPEAVRTDPRALTEYMERHRIESLDCTPSHLRMLLERGLDRNTALKFILVGGEALDPLWSQLADNNTIACYNLYGPTECGVVSVGCRVTSDTPPIIGKPFANVEVYVLDQQLNPAGIGMVGELYHGGDGLGRGYLNRPELTAERYIPHPFSHEPGARLYRTGDLVKYRPDGNLVFLGRCDHQVKLRGHRLELGEIQSVLLTHPAVRDAAVLLREGTEKLLVAYVVVEESSTDSKELRQYLRDRVPDYMVPSAIMELDQLPLTRNGKLDRSRLPAPAFDPQQATFVAPRTPTEESLARIWSEILNVERIGVNDNFFSLGGHSLLATQVFSRMQDVFGLELPLRALFEAPTVAELAERVNGACKYEEAGA
jgi:amino acid adenylation domain-containing protein